MLNLGLVICNHNPKAESSTSNSKVATMDTTITTLSLVTTQAMTNLKTTPSPVTTTDTEHMN